MKIFAQTPSRISLMGGGTDLEPFSREYGGIVLSLAINLRQNVILRTEDDLWEKHISLPSDADPQLAYTILDQFGINSMHHSVLESSFDGIMGAGLGSSGSFSVALIGAIFKSKAYEIDRALIAETAYDIEVNKLGWVGGRQDQIAAANGGLNAIRFDKKGSSIVNLDRNLAEKLCSYLLLVYTGGVRQSRKIQSNYKSLTEQQLSSLKRMKTYAEIALSHITFGNPDFVMVGNIMDFAYQLKKESNRGVATPKIDEVYDLGKKLGAIGGKVLGAGGGGYMLFFVDPIKRETVVKGLAKKGVEEVDFAPDFTGLDVRRL